MPEGRRSRRRGVDLCPVCWQKIHFIASLFCAGGGAPSDIPVSDGTMCGACLSDKPLYGSARTAILSDDATRKLILGFKHGDRTHMAKALAMWMHRAAGDLLAQADALIHVPLNRGRLFRRRYNQSALLAQHIGVLEAKPVLVDALSHPRHAQPGHRKRKELQENVRGAFAVNPQCCAEIEGKHLLLIDDVMTTGATVEECVPMLMKLGAK